MNNIYILQDGTIQDYDNNFSLLSPLICEAVAVKEDRRVRRTTAAPTSSLNSHSSLALGGNSAGADSMTMDSSTPMAVDEGSAGQATSTDSANDATSRAACTPSTVQLV